MKWPRRPTPVQLDTLFSLLQAGGDPAPTAVGGFSRYHKEVADLPPAERRKLELIADRVAASYAPGASPVVGVMVVGHADQDLARGPAFERQISRERAHAALDALRRAIRERFGRLGPFVHVDLIAMRAVGVGFRCPVHRQPTTEAQRAENRRVVIYLASAVAPVVPVGCGAFPVPPQKRLTARRTPARPRGAASAASGTDRPATGA